MCKRVFEHLDDDKNDFIEPQEIKNFLAREYQKESNKILKLFNFLPENEMKQTIAEFDTKLMTQLDLETDHYMQQMDTNQDGHVSRLEFLNFHLKHAGLEEEQPLNSSKMQQEFESLRECTDPEQIKTLAKRVFDFLDADHNGFIEPNEIEKFLKNMTMSNIDNIVQQYAHLPT